MTSEDAQKAWSHILRGYDHADWVLLSDANAKVVTAIHRAEKAEAELASIRMMFLHRSVDLETEQDRAIKAEARVAQLEPTLIRCIQIIHKLTGADSGPGIDEATEVLKEGEKL